MRVLLKLVLDCHPDDAWRAIRSPEVLGDVSFPFTTFESLEPGELPELWEPGEHPMLVKAFGMIPIGQQVIGISYPRQRGGVRIMRDTGHAIGGPLSLVTQWQHTLTVASAPGGRTLYRDELRYSAGAFTLLLWPVYWLFWQWRALGLKKLAPIWAARSGAARS